MMKTSHSTKAASNSQSKINNTGKFTGNQFRDVWASALYLLHFAPVGWFVYQTIINSPNSTGSVNTGVNWSELLTKKDIIGLFGGLAIAFGYSISAMFFLSAFTQGFIKFSFFATAGLLVVDGIMVLLASSGQISGIIMSVLAFVLAGLNILMYFWWKNRIPLAATLISTATSILKKNPAGWFVAGSALFSNILFFIGYATAIGMYQNAFPLRNENNLGTLYLVFSLFWTSQVIQNVAHTTNAGLFASYYFVAATGGALVNPTMSSFYRSITFSFGSICFGSLIIAVITLVRFLVHRERRENDSLLLVLLDCMIRILGDLAEYVNYYAYVQVAIYGKSFLESAKGVWNLFKSNGVDVIINDAIVDKCMGIMMFMVAVATGTTAFFFTGPIYMLVAVIASVIICNIMLSPISTGVSTTFVCMAENRSIIANTQSDLYHKLANEYPTIL